MGKKRHSQDKMWLTFKELVELYGGKKENVYGKNSSNLQSVKLPFDHCNLSFTPTNNPVCLKDGTIFDILNILPYIRKFKKNPIDGSPLKPSDLIKLNFHKNSEGQFYCPITYKVFNENSDIIAIKETGNVFSLEAYKNLNEKENYYYDLLNDTPFDKNNVIIIQSQQYKRDLASYYFIINQDDLEFVKNSNFDGSNLKDDISRVQNINEKDLDLICENKEEENINISSDYKNILKNYEKEYNNKENKDILKSQEIINNFNNKESDKFLYKYPEKVANMITKEKQEFIQNKKEVSNYMCKLIANQPQYVTRLENLMSINQIKFDEKQNTIVIDESIKKLLISKVKEDYSSYITSVKNKFEISSLTYFEMNLDYKDNNLGPSREKISQSTTSTIFSVTNDSNNKLSIKKRKAVFYLHFKDQFKKNYKNIDKNQDDVIIETNFGQLSFHLFFNEAPKTCENFIELANSGYYNNTIFHRLIPGFMIQGGDPTGSGTGGDGVFGENFEDEFNDTRKHNKAGMLSMANSGANSNKSQFFITFSEQNHLNNKHTVFGELLNKSILCDIEKIETDDKNFPKEEIIISSIKIKNNPIRRIISDNIIDDVIMEGIKKCIKLLRKNKVNLKTNIEEKLNSEEVGKYLNKKRVIDK